MAAPNPPSTEQLTPGQQAQQEAQQEVQQPVIAPEDRILSPDETRSMLQGEQLSPDASPQTDDEKRQAEMVQEFVGEHKSAAQQEPGAIPGQVPQAVADAAVQQMTQPQTVADPAAVSPAVAPTAPVAPAAQPGVQVPPQAVPQAPQPTPTEAALTAQVQNLTSQIGQLTQLQQSQQAQQPQQDAFAFQVPQSHMQALGSDDPNTATAALNAILNGVSNSIYQRISGEQNDRFNNLPQTVAPIIEAQQTQQNIKNDMYGTYPELSNMSAQVVAVAEQMQQQGLATPQWSPDFRDAIAERLAPLVPGLSQKVQANRNSRIPQQQVIQQVPQAPNQQLPQAIPTALPPGVQPVAMAGGTHVATPQQQAAAGQPMLIRDAAGNIIQLPAQSQQIQAGTQVRSNGLSQVDPGLLDIWSTLGYPNN